MGIKEKLFGTKREPQTVEIPAILQPDDPVNYDSVLDWLVGLSDKDYKTMGKVADTYREANKAAAKLLKVDDEPTTQLISKKLTDEQIDTQLSDLLETNIDDLKTAFENEPPVEETKKPHSPSRNKKITVNEK